jgi:hypothetical protein
MVCCEVAHNSSNDLLTTYLALRQELRGGSPYVRLRSGEFFAAMHVKDASHDPPLYGTILYLLEAAPPFRIASLSPKLCISERELEFAVSERCGLQYVTGLVADEAANLALVSFGQMDVTMRVAALPLDRLVALARTHTIDSEDVASSECVSWHGQVTS